MWWPVSVPCVLWGLDRKPTQARHQLCTGGRCSWLRWSQGTKSLLPALQVISAVLGLFGKLACEISGLSWGYLWNSFFSVCVWYCFCLFLFNAFTGGKAWDPKPLIHRDAFEMTTLLCSPQKKQRAGAAQLTELEQVIDLFIKLKLFEFLIQTQFKLSPPFLSFYNCRKKLQL